MFSSSLAANVVTDIMLDKVQNGRGAETLQQAFHLVRERAEGDARDNGDVGIIEKRVDRNGFALPCEASK